MSLSDIKKKISSGNIAAIEGSLYIGADVKLTILQALNPCTAEELDNIGKLYGLVRVSNYWLPENNINFAGRIAEFLSEEIMDFRSKNYGGAVFSGDSEIPVPDIKVKCWGHKWKKYVGIMDAFEYCEHCDEKRR